MASYFTLTLDTTAPTGGRITISSPTTERTVPVALLATDATQMKLWGDIVASTSSSTKITESTASWIGYHTSASVILSDGDGAKTVYVKFRDEVGNETGAISTVVVLDNTAPTAAISSGPDRSTISEVSGFDKCTFSWSVDEAFNEYKICIVPSNTSPHNVGTPIGITNGSSNMAATGSFNAGQAITSVITSADLRAASDSDGAKIIKIFVKDLVGNWSI